MSTAPQKNDENQEIDLSQVTKKISGFFDSIILFVFKSIQYMKRNIIIVGVLFILGVGLGIYLDKTTKVYDHQIIVAPNFSSTDYLYSKIDLINSKVNEGDTLFLQNVVGLKKTDKFSQITIEPITDIYRFIANNPVNFEFLKLLAEDGDLKKIVEEKLTSRNYIYHNISFSTTGLTTDEETVKPILKYLNDSDYFKQVQKQYVDNIKIKMAKNDTIISQIDGILSSFSKTANNTTARSSNLVYYNENTQLDQVIRTKEDLLKEQGNNRLALIDTDMIVKNSSSTINIKNFKGTNGKMKLVLPVLFLGLFVMFGMAKTFYKRQLAKNA